MKTIEDGINVNENFSVKISDNGKQADDLVSLRIAPSVGVDGVDAIIYADTNGNPLFIASCLLGGDKFEILYSMESDGADWWADTMRSFDIDPDDFEEGIESLLVESELLK